MSGFQRFINETEMVSFSGFLRAIGWLFVVVIFSVTASIIMLRDGEDYMTWCIQLAGLVVGGLLGGSLVGAFNTKTVRTTAKEYAPVAEAKERGKARGKAEAKQSPVNVENVENVTVTDEGA
jgi:hypothetical protein